MLSGKSKKYVIRKILFIYFEVIGYKFSVMQI